MLELMAVDVVATNFSSIALLVPSGDLTGVKKQTVLPELLHRKIRHDCSGRALGRLGCLKLLLSLALPQQPSGCTNTRQDMCEPA